MENLCVLVVPLLFFGLLLHAGTATALGNQDGSEEWGYVQVRPKAHMFWWLYRSPYRVEHPSKPWPIILWLQGGPGASGVGIGNFEEVGPLDTNLKPRNSTWLQKADLLFVDNPVGTGFSFVEHKDLFVKTDEEAATDLTTLLIEIFNRNESLQKSPLFLVAESYGGKYAVTLGLSILKAIEARRLKLKLGGVALGDSWISPEDFVFSWGPLLKDVSRLDDNGLQKSNRYVCFIFLDSICHCVNGYLYIRTYVLTYVCIFFGEKFNVEILKNRLARKIKKQIEKGKFVEATRSWSELENVITANSNNVDFYNFLQDYQSNSPALSATAELGSYREIALKRYSNYLTSKKSSSGGGLGSLLNGVIKKKLKIIPENVRWVGQSRRVFANLQGDFMKPRINEVDELLAKGVNVTVYNGQVDLICATKGTEAWLKKLKWEGLKSFLKKDRIPLYCKNDQGTKGFVKSYKNLHFYWILGAGHFVPTDQPCVALNMVGGITQSPAAS
ncbi:serine carboxypeptidase-like 51 isoform X1 [Prosopis cineraria]|uniref:serine carboxypeptidase-like 51 isoform X1 n=1 Tax=Prosopis cineraria TaxID=364024 RepID=UPI00240FFFD8|nr:serine carboxypeptidase-like 51 isoform X1 [Prosopis cineraria]